MGQTYNVPCDCGQTLTVTSAVSGTIVRCSCGADVKIPGLSELRRMMGQGPYATNAIQKINFKQSEGHEPAGDFCIKCSEAPDYYVDLGLIIDLDAMGFYESEFSESVNARIFPKIVHAIVLFWVTARGAIREKKYKKQLKLEDHDHLRTQFCLCGKCSRYGHRVPSSKVIRQLLKTFPSFQEFFKENGNAYIKVLGIHPVDAPETSAAAGS